MVGYESVPMHRPDEQDEAPQRYVIHINTQTHFGGRSRSSRATLILAACMGAAALVAVVGGLGQADSTHTDSLAVGKLDMIPDFLHARHDHTTSDLAASAHTLMDTASGIMQDARTHALAGDTRLPTGLHMAAGREMELAMPGVVGSSNNRFGLSKAMNGLLGDSALEAVHHGAAYQQLQEANVTTATSAITEGTQDASTPKVLGATGDTVFGGKNSSIVGFMGFSKKEPTVLGLPFPILMFLGVFTGCITVCTIGCCIARNTDLLKVNKQEEKQ